MPLFDQDEAIAGLPSSETESRLAEQPVNAPAVEQTSSWQAFKSSMTEYNTVGNVFHYGLADNMKDTNYNAWNDIKGTEYEPMWKEFIYADSTQDVDKAKAQVDEHRKQQEFLNNASSFDKIAGALGAGVIDPINLFPVANVYKASKIARTVYNAGENAISFGAASAVQQTILQQSEQSKEISGTEILANSAIGGVLGGAGGFLAKDARLRQENILKSIIDTGEGPSPIKYNDSISSAATAVAGPELKGLNAKFARDYLQVPYFHAPAIDGITSTSAVVRDATQRLVDIPIPMKSAAHPDRTFVAAESMESQVRYDQIHSGDVLTDMDKSYLRYTNTEAGAFAGVRSYRDAKTAGKLNSREFSEEVSKAMRRNDVSDIPEVAAAAKTARAEIDRLAKRMQELKILPEELDLKGAQSYFTRVWDVKRILKDRQGLEDTLTQHYISTDRKLDRLEAQARASETVDEVLGVGDHDVGVSDISRMSLDKGVPFTKARKLDIDDTIIEPWLVNDGRQVIQHHMMQANNMIRFKEFLHSFGVETPEQMRQLVKDEYQKAIATTKFPEVDTKTGKAFSKEEIAEASNKHKEQLVKELNKNTNHLNDLMNVMLGQYGKKGQADNALRLLRTYNYTTMLGAVVMSSIPDMAMPIMKNGLGRTFTQGWVGSLRDIVTGTSKLKAQDLQDMISSLDREMDDSIRVLLDPGLSETRFKSKLEQKVDVASNIFSVATGMVHWNRSNRRIAGRVIESRLLDDIKARDTKAMDRLAESGIDENMANRIANMQEKYGTTVKGTHLSNIRRWSDQAAAKRFAIAVDREVNTTSILPGKGDVPLNVQKNELYRTMFQFKSFLAASTTRILLSGLARRDMNTVQGITGLMSLGAASYVIKQKLAGKEPNMSPDNLMIEGMNRAGITGLLGDANFGLVLQPFFNKGGSRYASQNFSGYILGPSFSQIENAYGLAVKLGKEGWSEKDKNKALRFIPYQNLFYLKLLIDKLKD